MDEEQGLQSPIAGGIRGIRRSVSSNIFTGRAVPPPVAQPDPQTTSLLNQNSLSLTSISAQLSSVSEQVNSLSTSLITIKDNLAISDQIERQREAEKQKREAILAEQALREGKESELEKKIQFALLAPVRRVAGFAQNILSRLGNFLFILVGGWLTDRMFTLYRIKSEGNIDKLKEFERTFIPNLLLLAGIGTTMLIGIRRILGVVGKLSQVALKIAFSDLIRRPFAAALRFIRVNVQEFRKVLGNQLKRFFTRGIGGTILKGLGIGGVLTGGALGLSGAGGIGQKIKNFFKGAGGKKIVSESLEEGAKKPGFLKKLLPKGGGLGKVLGYAGYLLYLPDIINQFKERKEAGEGNVEAGVKTGLNIGGGAIGFMKGSSMTLPISGPLMAGGFTNFGISTVIGGIIYLLGGLIGGAIGSGLGNIIGNLFSGVLKLFGKGKNKKDDKKDNVEYKPGITGILNLEDVTDLSNTPKSTSEKDLNLISSVSNNKSNVADEISNYNESPNIINFPLAGSGKKESNLAATGGSSAPSDYLPNIPSSDFNNTSIALSESLYNVV